MGKGQILGVGNWVKKQLDKLTTLINQNTTDISELNRKLADTKNEIKAFKIWEGSFSGGEIEVPLLWKYKGFLIETSGGAIVPCYRVGSMLCGSLGILPYSGGTEPTQYACRYLISSAGNYLQTNSQYIGLNRENESITAIYGTIINQEVSIAE